jgi:hypothetical protein
MGRNNNDFHSAKTLSEAVERATDSYQVQAAHDKFNPAPKGPHADELAEARKKGGLTITTQYLDSKDDK